MKRAKDYEKMSVFEQVMGALEEGVAHARGQLTLRTTTLPAPAPKLSKARVVAIRKETGMSQSVFASCLNVPKRTVESWEQGARTPKAGEARLLQMAGAAPQQFMQFIFSIQETGSKSFEKRSASGRAVGRRRRSSVRSRG